jgi:hypothetical protein
LLTYFVFSCTTAFLASFTSFLTFFLEIISEEDDESESESEDEDEGVSTFFVFFYHIKKNSLFAIKIKTSYY